MRTDTENYSSTVIEGAVIESAVNEYTRAANEALREGVQAAQSGDRARARTALLRCTELDPTSESAWLWLASISEYPEELMAFLGNVLEINPHNARANQWMAATKALLAKTFVQRAIDAANGGQADFAAQCLTQALENDQNNTDAWMWMAKLADSQEGKLSYLEKVLELDAENEEALAMHAEAKGSINQALLAEARMAAVSGRKDAANDLLDAFIAENPDSEDGWVLRSHLADTFPEKIAAFERVLEINPSNMNALSGLDSLKAIMAMVDPASVAPAAPVAPATERAEDAMENTAYVLEAERGFEQEEVHHKSPTQDLVFPVAAADFHQRMTEVPEPEAAVQAVEEVEEAPAEQDPSWGMNTVAFTFAFPGGETAEPEEVSVDAETETAEAASSEPVWESSPVEDIPDSLVGGPSAQVEEFQQETWAATVVEETAAPVEEVQETWSATVVEESPAPVYEENAEVWAAPVVEEAAATVEEEVREPWATQVVEEVQHPEETLQAAAETDDQAVPSPHDLDAGVSPVPFPTSQLPNTFAGSLSDIDPGRSFVPQMIDLPSPVESQSQNTAPHFYEAPVVVDEPVPAVASFEPAAAEVETSSEDEYSIPIPASFNVADTFSKTGFETTLVRMEAERLASAPLMPCPFCRGENPSQAFTCGHCLATLSLSDLEMLLTNTHADKAALRSAAAEIEASAGDRPLSERELTNLGIAYLNLRDFEKGHACLRDASQLNPTNIVLSGQVNALMIRLDEIRQQEEAMGSMPREKKILVVDDSATVRKLIAGKLEKCGHEVFCAADGVEAIEALDSVVPDLILLDITMPRMDGYQVCKVIRGKDSTKDVPVVMISGKDGFFDKVRGRMAGSTGYITKPFGPETLMKAVETYLKGEVIH